MMLGGIERIMKNRFAWIISLALAAALLLAPAAFAADDGLFASEQEAADSPAWVRILPQALDPEVTQLFVVAGLGMDKTTATISLHERDESGAWKQVLSTPGFVGKYGLVLDAERVAGCGRTPVGVYHFNRAFGIAEDPGCAIEYVQVDENTWWSGDDREGMRYNEMVDIRDYPDLNRDESEQIVHYQYEYQYCLNISFNEEATPGRGSAIFLHCFGIVKPYTGGCVAVPENIMKQIMQRVQPDCVVVIDTLENLAGSEYPTDVFTVDYGASDIYTGTDMDAAVAAIWNEFKSWEGCELNAVRYAGDESSSEENLAWLNELAAADPDRFSGDYTECICFTSDFHSPVEGSGAWEADKEYTDWQWWLARTEDSGFELLTWGYG